MSAARVWGKRSLPHTLAAETFSMILLVALRIRTMDTVDRSNGYESIAAEYIAGRGTGGTLGASHVRRWASELPRGAEVLDLGCGTGVPISQALMESGLAVYGVDASPSMIAAFRRRFSDLPAECA